MVDITQLTHQERSIVLEKPRPGSPGVLERVHDSVQLVNVKVALSELKLVFVQHVVFFLQLDPVPCAGAAWSRFGVGWKHLHVKAGRGRHKLGSGNRRTGCSRGSAQAYLVLGWGEGEVWCCAVLLWEGQQELVRPGCQLPWTMITGELIRTI